MEKMLLKHLEGSKAGQTDRFDLPLKQEVVLGQIKPVGLTGFGTLQMLQQHLIHG